MTRFVLIAMVAALAGGCVLHPPKPWEKGILAQPAMTMAGDVLESRFDEHIHASKEAASGGQGVGGGGCGCN